MTSSPNKLSPESKNLLAWIGFALIKIQTTEHVIRFAMKCVIGKTNLTLEAFLSQDQKERNRTLGFILAELHKWIDLDDRFDETLCLFLEMRNTFVHNLEEIPGRSLDHDEGRAVARTFLSNLIHVTDI